MKRILAYLLPLIALASCGTASQYAQQRYADGIYERIEPAPEPVQIYSKEDFEQMAAEDIARRNILRDTVYIPVYERDASTDFLWGLGTGFALSSPWYSSWWWNSLAWRYGWDWWRFTDPWYYGYYGWGYDSWFWRPWRYDPWFYDPWYYDPWRFDPWYGPSYGHHPDHWAPKPGLSPDGRRYYGERRGTQPGGTQSGRPGRSNYRPGVSGGSYGSAGSTRFNSSRFVPRSGGSSVSRPGSSSGSGSRVTPGQNGYNYSRGYQGRNSGGSYSGGSNSSRSYERSNSSSWGSSSRSSGSSYSGGSSSRSYGGGGSSSRSGGGGSSSHGGGGRRR